MPITDRLAGPLVLLLILAAVTGCTTATAPSPAPAPASPGAPAAVAIQGFAFSPAALTVRSGTTVTWTNDDSAPHTVVSDSTGPAPFTSGQLGKGATYSFTFTTPGTYTYHCSVHPSMKGTVIVQT